MSGGKPRAKSSGRERRWQWVFWIRDWWCGSNVPSKAKVVQEYFTSNFETVMEFKLTPVKGSLWVFNT